MEVSHQKGLWFYLGQVFPLDFLIYHDPLFHQLFHFHQCLVLYAFCGSTADSRCDSLSQGILTWIAQMCEGHRSFIGLGSSDSHLPSQFHWCTLFEAEKIRVRIKFFLLTLTICVNHWRTTSYWSCESFLSSVKKNLFHIIWGSCKTLLISSIPLVWLWPRSLSVKLSPRSSLTLDESSWSKATTSSVGSPFSHDCKSSSKVKY